MKTKRESPVKLSYGRALELFYFIRSFLKVRLLSYSDIFAKFLGDVFRIF
jgi:hypothetical protein